MSHSRDWEAWSDLSSDDVANETFLFMLKEAVL
jgi:hypothetical protein